MPPKYQGFFGSQGKCAQIHRGLAQQKKKERADVGSTRQRSFKNSKKIDGAQLQSDIFQMVDKNKDGILQKSELKELMVYINDGKYVDDQDVDDLMVLCDKSKDGAIDKSEFLSTVMLWNAYVQTLPDMEALMNKYDADHSGKLDATELKKLLTDLNDGIAVDDDEVSWVLKNADLLGDGKIGRLELEKAIAVWFHHFEHSEGDQDGIEQKYSPMEIVSPERSPEPHPAVIDSASAVDTNQCKCGCDIM